MKAHQKQIRAFYSSRKKNQVTSCSACHVPQKKEISVVAFETNGMPGTFLPTVPTMIVHR